MYDKKCFQQLLQVKFDKSLHIISLQAFICRVNGYN